MRFSPFCVEISTEETCPPSAHAGLFCHAVHFDLGLEGVQLHRHLRVAQSKRLGRKLREAVFRERGHRLPADSGNNLPAVRVKQRRCAHAAHGHRAAQRAEALQHAGFCALARRRDRRAEARRAAAAHHDIIGFLTLNANRFRCHHMRVNLLPIEESGACTAGSISALGNPALSVSSAQFFFERQRSRPDGRLREGENGEISRS